MYHKLFERLPYVKPTEATLQKIKSYVVAVWDRLATRIPVSKNKLDVNEMAEAGITNSLFDNVRGLMDNHKKTHLKDFETMRGEGKRITQYLNQKGEKIFTPTLLQEIFWTGYFIGLAMVLLTYNAGRNWNTAMQQNVDWLHFLKIVHPRPMSKPNMKANPRKMASIGQTNVPVPRYVREGKGFKYVHQSGHWYAVVVKGDIKGFHNKHTGQYRRPAGPSARRDRARPYTASD